MNINSLILIILFCESIIYAELEIEETNSIEIESTEEKEFRKELNETFLNTN